MEDSFQSERLVGEMKKDCRFYEARFPEVEDCVMVQVKSIQEMGAYVALLEYNNIEGMILLSELSRRRIRSVNKLLKVGRQEAAIVLRVDKEKGYIDLSKRRASVEDVARCEERFNKAKVVHSILRHLAETEHMDLEDLCKYISWPLYQQYGHAFDAFKICVADPDAVFGPLIESQQQRKSEIDEAEYTNAMNVLSERSRDALLKSIQRRMTPQPIKIRADVELTCFEFAGVDAVKEAMRAGEAVGRGPTTNENNGGNDEDEEDGDSEEAPYKEEQPEVKVKLVAPPLYVLTTQTLDKAEGLSLLHLAMDACKAAIEKRSGKMVVKEPPRAVSERDDRLFLQKMAEIGEDGANGGGEGDDDDEEDEDEEGMGDIDVNKAGLSMDA